MLCSFFKAKTRQWEAQAKYELGDRFDDMFIHNPLFPLT